MVNTRSLYLVSIGDEQDDDQVDQVHNHVPDDRPHLRLLPLQRRQPGVELGLEPLSRGAVGALLKLLCVKWGKVGYSM